MRHQLSVCILVLACLTIACVGDDSSTGATLTDGSSGSTTKSTTGVGTTSEGTTGVGTTGEVPPEACVEPPSPPPALPVPLFDETSSTETIVLDLLDSRCPETFGLFPDLVPNFLRARFYLPWEMGGLPLGLFPLVVFTHGNSQAGDKYPEILEPLARNGFVVASIVQDGNTSSNARRVRLLCLAEALLDENEPWIGSGRLNGNYAVTGHSTGGLGAFLAAATIVNNPNLLEGHTLVSVAAIAPNSIPPEDQDALSLAEGAPPYFVLQGTGDGDTSGGAFSTYDSVLAVLAGASVLEAPEKALVWAYNVEHNEYGGGGPLPGLLDYTEGSCASQRVLGGVLASYILSRSSVSGVVFWCAASTCYP